MPEHNFIVSPRVLKHLSSDLIKDETIAVFELMKNSYDACAKECQIIFNTLGSSEPKVQEIIIKDNGIGMDIETVKNIWLVIGTESKANITSPNGCGRFPLGEKGIGRLSAHKLGNIINMVTRSKNNNEVHVFIDWNQIYSVPSIENFKIIIEEETPHVFKGETGTFLEITGLDGDWSRGKIRDIYRKLLTFNSPFESKNEFKVNINSDNKTLFEGLPAVEDILSAAMYKCEAKFYGREIKEFKYEFAPWVTMTDKIEGRTKQFLDDLERVLYRKVTTRGKETIDMQKYSIGEVSFKLYVFENNPVLKNFFPTSINAVRGYLKLNGGIQVFRDGIRVFNYGEPDNDWLGIDAKRVKRVGGNISNNIILGAVNLNRNDSRDLKEKTNREGFIEDEAYKIFVEAANFVLNTFIREINFDKERIKRAFNAKKMEPVVSNLDELADFIANTENKDISKETKADLLRYVHRIKDDYNEIKGLLISHAGLGLSLGVMVHETEKLIARTRKAVKDKNSTDAAYYVELLAKIIERTTYILKKSDIKLNPLKKLIETVLDTNDFRFRDHKINIIDEYSRTELSGFMPLSQAVSALLNILDNAIYWTCISPGERYITIKLTDEIDGYNSIIISDSGKEFTIPYDMLTVPFISGRPDNSGMGLGLYVVDLFMKEIGGKLVFPEKGDLSFGTQSIKKASTNAVVALCFKKT